MEPWRETRAVFLDIFKAFDKFWHEGLLFKLKCNGTGESLWSSSEMISVADIRESSLAVDVHLGRKSQQEYPKGQCSVSFSS